MIREILLIFIVLGISCFTGYSQHVVKIRSGILGLETPMWSHKTKEGHSTISDNPFYKPGPYKSPTLWFDFHALVEYEYKKKFSLFTGYSNSSLGGGLIYEYYGSYDWPETPLLESGVKGTGIFLILKELHRIPLYASFKIFETKNNCKNKTSRCLYFQGDLIGGASLLFYGKEYSPFLTTKMSSSTFENEGHQIIISNYFEYLNKFGFGLLIGANLRLRHDNHEFMGLTFYYEHGLKGMAVITQEGIIDNTFRYQNSVTSFGSQFSLRLTFPVFTYNFTKKKFYRD